MRVIDVRLTRWDASSLACHVQALIFMIRAKKTKQVACGHVQKYPAYRGHLFRLIPAMARNTITTLACHVKRTNRQKATTPVRDRSLPYCSGPCDGESGEQGLPPMVARITLKGRNKVGRCTVLVVD